MLSTTASKTSGLVESASGRQKVSLRKDDLMTDLKEFYVPQSLMQHVIAF